MRYVPRLVASLCAIVPVLALGAILASTVYQALPALSRVGLDLLITDGNPGFSMRAPLWGTILATALALAVAVPVSLSVAIVKREFQIPLVSRALGAVVGTLSGIPPVIYAICVLFIVPNVMAPKFAGSGLADQRVQAAILGQPAVGFGGLPDRIPNTSFLGGVLLGLLIIPFMIPLIDDALRGVPMDLRNGSLALGATAWHTLRHITLPAALPGIVSAITLGGLVAVGEAVIPYFVLGGSENIASIPNPVWDIFRRTPALTSWAATQMGGLGGEAESVQALAVSVSFASALMLVALALAIMGLERLALQWLARRAP